MQTETTNQQASKPDVYFVGDTVKIRADYPVREANQFHGRLDYAGMTGTVESACDEGSGDQSVAALKPYSVTFTEGFDSPHTADFNPSDLTLVQRNITAGEDTGWTAANKLHDMISDSQGMFEQMENIICRVDYLRQAVKTGKLTFAEAAIKLATYFGIDPQGQPAAVDISTLMQRVEAGVARVAPVAEQLPAEDLVAWADAMIAEVSAIRASALTLLEPEVKPAPAPRKRTSGPATVPVNTAPVFQHTGPVAQAH